MNAPRQQWYVIARASEITTSPLARTVCGEHIVLYRRTDGEPVALTDRCPHRGFPLSLGAVVGDQIQCGYHGLRFDSCGTCVWAPLQENIPSRANVSARPLVTTGPWVWVWMGDPRSPDFHKMPSIPWIDNPEWTVVHGMEPLVARYSLLVDNLLDLSHETFLHAGFIGTPEVAMAPFHTRIDDDAGVAYVSRRMEAVECPPFYARSTGFSSPIDRWQDIEYHPVCHYVLHSRIAPAGIAPRTDGTDPDAAHVKVLYGITPVDENHTLDFWAVCRDFALDDAEVSAFLERMNAEVVMQDVKALEVLEARLAAEVDPSEVSLKIDTGGLGARRLIARQIKDESTSMRQ